MRRRNGRGDGRGCSDGSHGRRSRRAGTGETGGLALSDAPPAHLLPAALSLSRGVKVSALGGDDRPHPPGQRRNVVKQRQRREVIAPAGVVAPACACTYQYPAVVAGRRLADLNVDALMVQRDFAADSYAAMLLRRSKETGAKPRVAASLRSRARAAAWKRRFCSGA